MQVDPTKPTMNAPKSKRLRLTCDKLPSSFAFKFNLCRYGKCVVKNIELTNPSSKMISYSARLEAGAHTRPLLSSA